MLLVHLTAELTELSDLSRSLSGLLPLAVDGTIEGPEAEDVKAGWTAFAIFGLLALAVALLGWSLTKRLKKVDASEEAGRYDPSDKPKRRTTLPRADEEPVPGRSPAPSDPTSGPEPGEPAGPDQTGR